MSATDWMDKILSFLSHGVTAASGWQIAGYTLLVTHITIAAVTIYLHRCQTHRALELHAIPSHFFRFWLWLTTGQITKEWVAIHRKHHAKCETEDDPHSPVTRGIRKVLFEGAELYRAETENQETIAKFGYGTPDDWIERHLYSKYQWQGLGLMLIIDIMLFGVIGLSVWAVQMMWIPVTAAGIINGIGHYWGYRNYECNDAATNIFPLGILIGGEEMHNNHHTYATSAKLSSKWYEFDIGWLYIRILETLGLAKVKKLAPKPKFARHKAVADLATLQAVITNRYDVMNRYAKSIKHALQEEVHALGEKAQLDAGLVKAMTKLLQHEPAKLQPAQQQQLKQLFSHSKALQTMYDMRLELALLWERSNASREQLLRQLQDWCARAETSGVKALTDFSRQLRSYT